MTTLRLALRSVAIVIALLAIMDPAISARHGARAVVSIVASSQVDSAHASRIERMLTRNYAVLRAPTRAARATVIIGDALPREWSDLAAPVFVVRSNAVGPRIAIENISAPASAALAARVPVGARMQVRGARDKVVNVTLSAGGVALDHVARRIGTDDERVDIPLTYVPTAPGAVALRVTAAVADHAAHDAVDLAVDIRDTRRAVLFFDRRPSWMSRFVRLAIEDDGRFVVTSRVMTSRNISTDIGAPPAALDELSALGFFDVIVVGAPDALSDADITGLEKFLRRRGGTVVLLGEEKDGAAYARLTGAREWNGSNLAAVIAPPSSRDSMRVSELAWPAQLPSGARAIALARASARGGAAMKPIVWQTAVGAGRVVVSGALDAWTMRDPAVSGFESFWRALFADEASVTPGAVEVRVPPLVTSGEIADIVVALRDVVFAEPLAGITRASAAAVMERNDAREVIHLWPDATVGMLRGTVRAPRTPGVYRVVVTSNGARGEAALIVAPNVARPVARDTALVDAFALSRGGASFNANADDALRAALRAAVNEGANAAPWHPMRSVWWIVPFALALGGEWWLRRRRGLA